MEMKRNVEMRTYCGNRKTRFINDLEDEEKEEINYELQAGIYIHELSVIFFTLTVLVWFWYQIYTGLR